VAIVRGLAVRFDAGPHQCGAVECAMEEIADVFEYRAVQEACDRPPVMVWLGLAGLCADHAALMRLDPGRP
jgi:hypothetical protein